MAQQGGVCGCKARLCREGLWNPVAELASLLHFRCAALLPVHLSTHARTRARILRPPGTLVHPNVPLPCLCGQASGLTTARRTREGLPWPSSDTLLPPGAHPPPYQQESELTTAQRTREELVVRMFAAPAWGASRRQCELVDAARALEGQAAEVRVAQGQGRAVALPQGSRRQACAVQLVWRVNTQLPFSPDWPCR